MERFNWIYCLIFLVVFAQPAPSYAQEGELDFFAINQGLSSPVITDIIRDEQGYLWMGTLDGLNRFDGYQFRTFNQGPYSKTKLSRGNIEQLSLDLENKLIITYQNTPGYFDRFDPTTFSVERVSLLGRDEAEGHPKLIATDNRGRTFIVYKTAIGLDVYEYTPEELKPVIKTEQQLDWIATRVELLVLDNTEFILYDQQYGLRHFSATGELLYQYYPSEEASADYRDGLYERPMVMIEGANHQVYFSFFDRAGLYVYDHHARNRINPVPNLIQDSAYYVAAWRDQTGQILLSSRDSSAATDLVDHFYLIDEEAKVHPYDELLAAGQRVFSVVSEDFYETVNLGTFSGLAVFRQPKRSVQTYLAEEQGEEDFANLVRGITADPGNNIYFLIEDEGLFRIDNLSRELDSIPLPLDVNGEDLIFKDAGNLIYSQDSLLYFNASPPIASGKGWLVRYDLVSCLTSVIIASRPLTSLCNGPDGSLFAGTAYAGGKAELLRYDEGSQGFVPLRDARGENFLPNAAVIHLSLSVDQEELFIGTKGEGFLIYNLINKSVQHFKAPLNPDQESPVLFNDYTIYHVLEEPDGNLWISTRGGLHLLDRKAERISEHFSRVQGLSSNVICGMVPAGPRTYWISTYYGLTYFEPDQDPMFHRYYRSDGLSNNEFNRYAFYRDQAGRNYFGGVNGLNVFINEDLRQTTEAARVVITKISAFGRKGTREIETNLNWMDQLVIQRNEKSIAVQFAMPATPRANRNRFRVKLEGQDKDWVELGSDHTARYSNLSSGYYTLLVQGSDANGNYAENSLELTILVKQFIWEKPWFLIILGLMLAASMIGVLYYRLQDRLRAERLRTQLSSDIHDEVSGLLAGITMQTELLQGHTESDHLKTRLQGVGEAGRKAMSKLSDVIWSIDSRRDTIGELFQRMQEHADDVLLPLDIKYRFQFDGPFDEQKTMSGEIRQDLYFIYKEAINNIARHSNGNQVSIILSEANNRFEMLIEDNGSLERTNGLADSRSIRTGQGLANLKMRANRLKAKLDIDTESGYRILLNMKRL